MKKGSSYVSVSQCTDMLSNSSGEKKSALEPVERNLLKVKKVKRVNIHIEI